MFFPTAPPAFVRVYPFPLLGRGCEKKPENLEPLFALQFALAIANPFTECWLYRMLVGAAEFTANTGLDRVGCWKQRYAPLRCIKAITEKLIIDINRLATSTAAA